MASRNTTHRMRLSQFNSYLQAKEQELARCYQEIEEVQAEFNDIFRREMAAWQATFSRCFPEVLARRQEMPEAFRQQIDLAEQEELRKLQDEMAQLESEVASKRGAMDRLTAAGQALVDEMRSQNPELDKREETLKKRVVRLQNEYTKAWEEAERLSEGLGWLTHAAKLAQQRKAQKDAKQKQEEAIKRLNAVRQQWLTKVEEISQSQAELRRQWQEQSVEAAEKQGRLDHIRNNLADLAQQNAITRVLEELDQDPAVDGELGDALRELIQRNRVRADYETGLASVAEALGLTKGVGEGLRRFGQSVATVIQEQRRYNLKDVPVILPRSTIALNETWRALADKVKDEKQMGTNPLEFSRIIKTYISDRLTDASIQGLFETMGAALNKATKAWN
jgi:chromosome segregation ATPase